MSRSTSQEKDAVYSGLQSRTAAEAHKIDAQVREQVTLAGTAAGSIGHVDEAEEISPRWRASSAP